MAKEYLYRGHTIEELKRMDLSTFISLLPARQRRSLKRGLTKQQKIFLDKLKKSSKPVKTHRRDMIILPEMIGKEVMVHNGKEFVRIKLEPVMIGHYLGEYVLTRKPVKHSGPGIGATRSSMFTSKK